MLGCAVGLLLLLMGSDPDAPEPVSKDSETATDAKWRPILDRVAEEYELQAVPDSKPLQLVKNPVYQWARAREGDAFGTYGTVYVWTNQGNAEAVACFWRSSFSEGSFSIMHELHSLSPTELTSKRPGPECGATLRVAMC